MRGLKPLLSRQESTRGWRLRSSNGSPSLGRTLPAALDVQVGDTIAAQNSAFGCRFIFLFLSTPRQLTALTCSHWAHGSGGVIDRGGLFPSCVLQIIYLTVKPCTLEG